MVGMSFVAIIVCGMSYCSGMGIGGYLGIYNNDLTGNIPFLLLGRTPPLSCVSTALAGPTRHTRTFRSALYNWPAKIEHWPADSNGFFTGETKHSTEYGRVFRYIFDL